MTQSSTMQLARDILARWRSEAVPGRWASNDDDYLVEAEAEWGARFGDLGGSADSIPLIVGTAGNPDLLDAIDEILDRGAYEADDSSTNGGFVARRARRIADAILAAEKRMTSTN